MIEQIFKLTQGNEKTVELGEKYNGNNKQLYERRYIPSYVE